MMFLVPNSGSSVEKLLRRTGFNCQGLNALILHLQNAAVWYKRSNSGTNEIQNSSRENTRCE
eukprot:449411-Rhodomonas_salina.1